MGSTDLLCLVLVYVYVCLIRLLVVNNAVDEQKAVIERVNATVTRGLQDSPRVTASEVNEVSVIQEDGSDQTGKVTAVLDALLEYMKNLTLVASGVNRSNPEEDEDDNVMSANDVTIR